MNERPNPGDVVFLNSGSPPLTVAKIDGNRDDGYVDVEWFVGDEQRRDAFHHLCLSQNNNSWVNSIVTVKHLSSGRTVIRTFM